MTPKNYQDNFYNVHLEDSLNSAKEVIPVILKYITPKSVIDVGCGIGTWLSIWKEYGVNNITGVDGSYVISENLLIDKKDFIAANLEKGFNLNQQFDLVSSLEVAEHIKPEHAEIFVASLCDLGDIILFSAAIPGQDGTLHLNEQYPDYWIQLFAKHGFTPYDCIREHVWNNEKVSLWYRQNSMFFIRNSSVDKYSNITKECRKILSIVHPGIYDLKTKNVEYYERILKNPYTSLRYFMSKYRQKIKTNLKK